MESDMSIDENELNKYISSLFSKKDPSVKDQIEEIHPQIDFYYNSFNICLGKQGSGKTALCLKELIKLSKIPNHLYNLILYVARILVELQKKVLIIDSTILGRARYTVPSISPSKCYVTEFEGMDVAIGFDKIENIEDYLGTAQLQYDMILIDIDTHEDFIGFDMENADKNYFVTGFDNYSLKKGLEAIGKMQNKIPMTKILFSRDMLQEEDDYLNFLSFYYSIQWNGDKIYFPFDNGDSTVIIENQRAAKISFRNLSTEYKDGLLELAQQIVPETRNGEIKRIIKNI